MSSSPFIPQRIVVAAHPQMAEAIDEAAAMAAHLQERGLTALSGTLDEASLRERVQRAEFDLLIAVGGDGTLLRAAHLCAPWGVPILGVNLGSLGFLIQIQRDEWRATFDLLLIGESWIENRMMLRAEHWRENTSLGNWHALNEAVVCRGEYVRPLRLSASVDGRLLTAYVADGLIAATPTGSTAYALAAGGPILPPELRNILLVPIAPHLSVDRGVVLSEGSSVSITVQGDGNAVLCVDGQTPIRLAEDDRVEVRAGDYGAKFVRFSDPGYFYRNLTAHMNQNPSMVAQSATTIGLPR
ncbi:MAG: NAD(+)/NADH kinase [Anaerolineales bacterium]|nr:NAD(+)/NADH kinase [Anaerolineales bacterium]